MNIIFSSYYSLSISIISSSSSTIVFTAWLKTSGPLFTIWSSFIPSRMFSLFFFDSSYPSSSSSSSKTDALTGSNLLPFPIPRKFFAVFTTYDDFFYSFEFGASNLISSSGSLARSIITFFANSSYSPSSYSRPGSNLDVFSLFSLFLFIRKSTPFFNDDSWSISSAGWLFSSASSSRCESNALGVPPPTSLFRNLYFQLSFGMRAIEL